MIPILYEKDEQNFISNGIGRLRDALLCYVEEERNGMYDLELTYPVNGIRYGDLQIGRIIVATPLRSGVTEPFRIYRIAKPMNGKVTVSAHHISYDLKRLVAAPFSAASAQGAMAALKAAVIEGFSASSPFTFWTDIDSAESFAIKEPRGVKDVLGGDKSILDTYGGEFVFSKFAVRLFHRRGGDNGVVIRYGKNLTEITGTLDSDEAYTSVVPYWVNPENEDDVEVGELVEYDTAEGYSEIRSMPLDVSEDFESRPSHEDLQYAGSYHFYENDTWKVRETIELSFVDLHSVAEYAALFNAETIALCDDVTVVHPDLGISAKLKVERLKYNVLEERIEKITLGQAKKTLADYIRSDRR